MANRFSVGLDRFKKAQSAEPFDISSSTRVTANIAVPIAQSTLLATPSTMIPNRLAADDISLVQPSTAVGLGNSTWQPPDWTTDPKSGVYTLEVQKDGKVVDSISLVKKRTVFGRQLTTCDFVLDHPSLSRQHAAVVHHKNGRIFVFDLGSVHGTFVSNERVSKETPVELEPGQSLRFAASTRVYFLRKQQKTVDTFFPPPKTLPIQLPPPPDNDDVESVVAYNTMLNRLGVSKPEERIADGNEACEGNGSLNPGFSNLKRAREESDTCKQRKSKIKRNVVFRDECGGELATVVGISDGADVSTEPGPIGVKEGSSLSGKFNSLVQTTLIPKKTPEDSSVSKLDSTDTPTKSISRGVSDGLKDYINKLKSPGNKVGLYGGLLDKTSASFTGGSWGGTHKGHDRGSIGDGNKEEALKSPGLRTNLQDLKMKDDDTDLFSKQ